MSKDVADCLRHARSLIDRPEKWAQGSGETASGQRCIVTAIADAFRGNGNWGVSHGRVLAAFRRAIDGHADIALARWNDSPDRTHAEVMAAFDRAIESEEI
jgi:hypothetical protein